jgi:hypothetical protein
MNRICESYYFRSALIESAEWNSTVKVETCQRLFSSPVWVLQFAPLKSEDGFRFKFRRAARTSEFHICVSEGFIFFVVASLPVKPFCSPNLVANCLEYLIAIRTRDRLFLHG